MFERYQNGIADECRESYPAAWILGENLLYLTCWTLVGLLLWPFQWSGWPIATLVWVALVLVIQILLKKHNCSGCYYYGKRCHLGWGKLAAWLYRADSGDPETGMKLSLFYILSPPLAVAGAIVAGILYRPGATHWVLLGLFVAVNVVALALRPRGCRVCAMRNVCPGSACKPG